LKLIWAYRPRTRCCGCRSAIANDGTKPESKYTSDCPLFRTCRESGHPQFRRYPTGEGPLEPRSPIVLFDPEVTKYCITFASDSTPIIQRDAVVPALGSLCRTTNSFLPETPVQRVAALRGPFFLLSVSKLPADQNGVLSDSSGPDSIIRQACASAPAFMNAIVFRYKRPACSLAFSRPIDLSQAPFSIASISSL